MEIRLFRTTTNQFVLVFKNAGANLCFLIYELQHDVGNNKIDKLELIHINKMNVIQDVYPLMKNMYEKSVNKFPSEQSFMSCMSLTDTDNRLKVVLAEDVTAGLMTKNFSITPISSSEVTPFLINLFGYVDPNTNERVLNIPIKDINTLGDSTTVFVETNDIVSHKPADTLTAEEKRNHICQHDADLSASIESTKSWLTIYRHLTIKDNIQPHKLILLYGPKGVGKTTAAEHISYVFNIPYVSITGDPSLTVEDIFCTITPNMDCKNESEIRKYLSDTYDDMFTRGGLSDDEKQKEFDKIISNLGSDRSQWKRQMSNVFRAYTEGWMIIINEVNNFSQAVLIAFNDAFYGSKRSINIQGQTYFAHPKTIVVCTTNYGYQGNNPMNEAFIDRFKPVLMTDMIDETYAKYISKKYPNVDVKGISLYVKFMFKLMKYMEETFENQDRYSPATPAISIRRFTELLPHCLALKSVKQPLGDELYAILHGVEDAKTTTQGILTNFDSDISAIELALFTDKTFIAESNKLFKKCFTVVTTPSSTSSNTNSLDSLFAKAASTSVKTSDDCVDILSAL